MILSAMRWPELAPTKGEVVMSWQVGCLASELAHFQDCQLILLVSGWAAILTVAKSPPGAKQG
jgi:hypothetical protein